MPARSALRGSSSGNLVVPRTRRRIGHTAFSVSTPRAWNTLPTQLKLLWSTTTFRRQHFCTSLPTDTGKQTDDCSVMRRRSPSRGAVQILQLHTHPFKGPFSGTTQVSRYQKGKTNPDFTEAKDSEWQWHQLGHYMQVCTLLQTDNHTSTPPLCFLQV